MLAMRFPGLKVADVEHTGGTVRISISVDSDAATCPDCGRQSTAVHSVYVRRRRDLPIPGELVELQALVHRFRRRNSDCARITFSESLGWLAKRHAQRTDRVRDVLRSLVSMLSSTLSTILAFAIGIRASSSTLLRAVDRSYCLAGAPRVLGIDDFAIVRGRTYGTFLCDLETGRPVDILAGRMAEPVAQWISQHPGVEIVARDRATAYAQAVSSAAPGAIQVDDRFRLVRNVNDAFREVIDGRRWVIPGIAVDTVPEPCTKKPGCPTRSELARLAAGTRLEDRYEEAWRLFHEGKSIRALGHDGSRSLVKAAMEDTSRHPCSPSQPPGLEGCSMDSAVPARASRPLPAGTGPFVPVFSHRPGVTARVRHSVREVRCTAMPESVKQHALRLVHEFRRARYPDDMWADYRLCCQMRPNTMTLFKRYASQDQRLGKWKRTPLAQSHYNSERDPWTLSYADIDRRWRRCDGTSQLSDLMALLDEVSRDPNGIFFGDRPTSGTS